MDKFGIFNVLSALIGGNKPDSDAFSQDNESSERTTLPVAGKKPPTYNVAETRAAFPPLQASMLETMKNHDEFVKRVRDKNKKG